MYQQDALLKAAEKRHQVSAGLWPMGVSSGGHLGLGVPVRQEPGLGRGRLSPSRDYTRPVWPCCGWHVLEELTTRLLLKCKSWLWHSLVTQAWNTAVAAGPHPGHCSPSRIKLQEVSCTLRTLLGFCHCQAVLSCHWRDTCDPRGTRPQCPAHQHGCLKRQARDLWRGHSLPPPVLTEILEEIWLSFWDGVKTNAETLSVVMTGLKPALAKAHTALSRGRRWDAEGSVALQGARQEGSVGGPATLPMQSPSRPGPLRICGHIYPRAELCHTPRAEARLTAFRRGSAEPMPGPQGAQMCASPWGNTPQPRQRKPRDRQTHL